MKPSLRRRLLTLLLTAVLLTWATTAVFIWQDARHEFEEILDAQMAQQAELIASQFLHGIDKASVATTGSETMQEHEIAFQVWDRSNTLRLRSARGPGMRMSQSEAGFSDVTIDGQRWRTYSRRDDSGQYLVQVGEHYSLRDELAEAIAGHVMHPMLVALPILAALVWFAIGAGLMPLGRLAAEVGRRAPDNLVPLEEKAAPREVLPLLVAINRLFVRLAASIEQERRFTADAAHELRTPLAAVKVHAQVALGASNDEERERALGQIVTGTNRVAHLLEQLLTLARLDPQIALAQTQRQTVSLSVLAAECVADLGPAAAAKTVEVHLTVKDDGLIAGDPALLAILLRNLVDNAVRYTQPGGEIEVSIIQEEGGATLRVTDNGPGIPQAERAHVFERFYRVLGTSEEGSGLGLSIVKRIADLHRASTELAGGPGGRGLSVSVKFPPGAA